MKIHSVFITYNRLELTKVAIASYCHSHANAGPVERLASQVYKCFGWHVWVKPNAAGCVPDDWIVEGECVNTGDSFSMREISRRDHAFVAGFCEALRRRRGGSR